VSTDVLRHFLRQVTYTQFASVMATLGFVLSDEQRDLLCKAFSVEGSSGFMNYRELLKRIDPAA
jgi:hypothetical protein